MGGSEAEAALNKLRKLGTNRECVNCKAQSRLGFGAICVKYGTFVCNYCKSSHQAYSHRVKSATMSTWTMPEVEALRKRNGGGNEVARAIWYAKWTPKDEERFMPREGDKIDRWKELIHMVYEEKRWYDPDATVPSTASSSSSAPSSGRRNRRAAPSPAPALVSADSPALGQTTSMFDSLTIKAKPAPQPVASAADELDLFGGADIAAAPAATSSGADVTDLFADFDAAAPAVTSSAAAGFSFIDAAPAPSLPAVVPFQASTPADDPFAVLHQPAPGAWGPPASQHQHQHRQLTQHQHQPQQQHQQQQAFMMQQEMQPAWQMPSASADPFAGLHAPQAIAMRPAAAPAMGAMPGASFPNGNSNAAHHASATPAMGMAQRPMADPNDPFAGLC